MRLNASPGPRHINISLTPLIDVVFILLFFFMLASKFDTISTLSLVSAPISSSDSVSPRRDTTVLTLGIDGSVRLNGKTVSSDALIGRMRAIAATAAPNIIIRPHAQTSIQHLVTLMDDVGSAGVRDVAIEHLR